MTPRHSVGNGPQPESRRRAVRFIVLLGVISLLGDVTYEGARSVTGPFLGTLGASAAAVGFVSGLGELVGYGLRLVSGYVSDRTGNYWTIALTGYVVNLLAVPALALAGSWEMAAALIVAERVGKAIRKPARDAMLSHAASEVGRGWGFGLHEALDQTGAVLGPLIVSAVLFFGGGYRSSFAVLLIPALMAICVLAAARALYPVPRDMETQPEEAPAGRLPAIYWLYLAGAALVAAGYADFPLIAYHFHKTATVPRDWIPVLYALAMAVDAIAALVFGRLYDRSGLVVLAGAVVMSALFAPLVFLGGAAGAWTGVALWGIGLGGQESVMRAAIAGMAPAGNRGTAYGAFNAGFGIFWFAGSTIMGWLYDASVARVVAFSVAAQLASIPVLLAVARRERAA